jgi:WD40 repeat protein
LRGHSQWVFRLAFSPDDTLLASSSNLDGTVRLWHPDGTLLKTVVADRYSAQGLAFSPDGVVLATAGAEKVIKLWNRDGRLLRELRGHTAAIMSLAFSPDGSRLLSASQDGTVRIWRWQTDFDALYRQGCTLLTGAQQGARQEQARHPAVRVPDGCNAGGS